MSKAFLCDNCKVLQEGAPRLSFTDKRSITQDQCRWYGTDTWDRRLSWRHFDITLALEGTAGDEWCRACTERALFDAIENLIANQRLTRPEPEVAP